MGAVIERLKLPPHFHGIEIASVVRTDDNDGLGIVVEATGNAAEDPTTFWGIVLADIAHHVAAALEGKLRDGAGLTPSKEEILTWIYDVMNQEHVDQMDS